jgi:hypothetical protein
MTNRCTQLYKHRAGYEQKTHTIAQTQRLFFGDETAKKGWVLG